MEFRLCEMELQASVPNEIQIEFMLYFKTFKQFHTNHLGVVQSYDTQNCPSETLSRTFRAPAGSGWRRDVGLKRIIFDKMDHKGSWIIYEMEGYIIEASILIEF